MSKLASVIPEALPHGDLEEVFPDIFFVTGTSRPTYNGQSFQFSRNMTVVREGGALTLINAVRLGEAGLAQLERLGEVTNVARIGAMHGMDDAFYVDRYGAKLWALPGHANEHGLTSDVELVPGGPLPFGSCTLFLYETARLPEAVLLLDRGEPTGGILISCDSLQNWLEPDRFFDEGSAQMMRGFGFFAPANVGPGWMRACEPKARDFERIKGLRFRHLLSAHGVPLRDAAYEQLGATFQRLFNVA